MIMRFVPLSHLLVAFFSCASGSSVPVHDAGPLSVDEYVPGFGRAFWKKIDHFGDADEDDATSVASSEEDGATYFVLLKLEQEVDLLRWFLPDLVVESVSEVGLGYDADALALAARLEEQLKSVVNPWLTAAWERVERAADASPPGSREGWCVFCSGSDHREDEDGVEDIGRFAEQDGAAPLTHFWDRLFWAEPTIWARMHDGYRRAEDRNSVLCVRPGDHDPDHHHDEDDRW